MPKVSDLVLASSTKREGIRTCNICKEEFNYDRYLYVRGGIAYLKDKEVIGTYNSKKGFTHYNCSRNKLYGKQKNDTFTRIYSSRITD